MFFTKAELQFLLVHCPGARECERRLRHTRFACVRFEPGCCKAIATNGQRMAVVTLERTKSDIPPFSLTRAFVASVVRAMGDDQSVTLSVHDGRAFAVFYDGKHRSHVTAGESIGSLIRTDATAPEDEFPNWRYGIESTTTDTNPVGVQARLLASSALALAKLSDMTRYIKTVSLRTGRHDEPVYLAAGDDSGASYLVAIMPVRCDAHGEFVRAHVKARSE